MKYGMSASVLLTLAFCSSYAQAQIVPTPIQPMNTLHNSGASVAYDGKYYLWSGYSTPIGNNRTEKLEIYDPTQGTLGSWSYGADSPVERNGATAFELGGKLYSIGGEGHNSGSFSNTVHRYDPVADAWEAMSNFPVNAWDRYGVVLDGTAYVLGGRSGYGGTQTSMWAYDEPNDSWNPRASMLDSTMLGATAAVNGKIYVIGGNHRDTESSGYRYTSAVQMYDPNSDTWELVSDAPAGFASGAGVAYEDKIYVFAKDILVDDSWIENDKIFCFDTIQQTWTSIDFAYPADVSSFNNGLGLINDNIYMTADDNTNYSAYMLTIPEPAYDLGDMNGDGLVNAQDINPFVLAMTDTAAWVAQYPQLDLLAVGDIGGSGQTEPPFTPDGYCNAQDITPFVYILTHLPPGGAGDILVPEPATMGLLGMGALGLLLRRRR